MAASEKNQEMINQAKSLKNVPWCEQYERMISGMLYDSFTPELEASRFKARAWCHKYNSWFPSPDEFPDANFQTLADERHKQLKEIIGHVGEDVFIEPPFTVDYGCNLRLGERCYANFNLCVLDCGLVTLGDRVMFGPNVSIFAATHETDVQSRRDNVEYAKEVEIGDDCWIGGHTVILPGVHIGEGCTIGAGSIVTKDIPAWSVAVGNPCRVVKKVTPLEKLEGRKSSFSAVERIP